MTINKSIGQLLENDYDKIEKIYRHSLREPGYWSNLNVEDNDLLIEEAENTTVFEAVTRMQPELSDIIFEHGRDAGLELLQLKGNEICADFGCMWGAIAIPLAKRVAMVIGVDQTLHSLRLLKARTRDENIDNICLVHDDVKCFPILGGGAVLDVAIVNGVLEWVPEVGKIELKKYYGIKKKKKYEQDYSPQNIQKNFLKMINSNLKDGGKLYLAIENRYDFKMFFGGKDPHANLYFTSILPKKLANWVSWKILGRPYVTWIYSKNELVNLVASAGFSDIEVYCAFPDYRMPKLIQGYDKTLSGYRPVSGLRDKSGNMSVRRLTRFAIEYFTFGLLRLAFFSPSFILIAKK